MKMSLQSKQEQFNAAMNRYNSTSFYRRVDTAVAVANIALQILLLSHLEFQGQSFISMFAVFLVAYLLTDFINGFIHMIMDHTDNYDSAAGPLIAKFHLHHKTIRYQTRPLYQVYFIETGAKVWLVAYQLIAVAIISLTQLPVFLQQLLIYLAILSSVAEVSHYLSHNSKSSFVLFLGKMGVLLSRKHHMKHHSQDNMNYAFLNGWSDPLLNAIARQFFSGYKQASDLHFAEYGD